MKKIELNKLGHMRFDAKTLVALSVREKCAIEFPMHNFTSEYIVYYEEEDNIEVLGYFLIKEEKITHSKYYDKLRLDCINYGGYDTDALVEKKAYQLIELYIKDEFKDEKSVYSVFEIITELIGELNNTVILWRDGEGEIVFYPITNDEYKFTSDSACTHFTESFLK